LEQNKHNYNINEVARELRLDPVALRKLLDEFIESEQEYLNPLKESIKEREFERIHIAAHALKGTALELRLKKLAQVANEISENAKNKTIIDYYSLYKEIKNLFLYLKNRF